MRHGNGIVFALELAGWPDFMNPHHPLPLMIMLLCESFFHICHFNENLGQAAHKRKSFLSLRRVAVSFWPKGNERCWPKHARPKKIRNPANTNVVVS